MISGTCPRCASSNRAAAPEKFVLIVAGRPISRAALRIASLASDSATPGVTL